MSDHFRFIHFTETANPGRKTKIWVCYTNSTDMPLGIVQWYSPWRQYCFYPTNTLVLSADCLRDLVTFIDGKQREHKEERP